MFLKKFVISLVPFIFAGTSHSALVDRGNGLIWDSTNSITWLQDANIAQSLGISSDGKMDKSSAANFAESFELVLQDGVTLADEWRLPSMADAETGISSDSEIGNLLYDDLGNTPGSPLLASYYGDDGQFNFGFSNLPSTGLFWLDEEPMPGKSNLMWAESGWHSSGNSSWLGYAWLVHDGDIANSADVAAVPVPASAFLFGPALLGLIITRRQANQ